MITDEDILDYLEHFGIKGQRWGVRKSPEQKQSDRNAKAQKYVDKAADAQKQIDFYKSRPAKPGFKNFERKQIRELEQKKAQAIDDAQRKREGKLSKKQKQIAVGAGAAAALLVAYGTYQSLNSGNARRLVEKGKAFATKKPPSWKQDMSLADPNLDVNGIKSKVVSHINPKYGAPGTKMNCRRATYAYEMRRRGYDVAATRTTNARGQEVTGLYNVLNPDANMVPPGRIGILTRFIGERKKDSKPFTEALNKPFGKTNLYPDRIFDALSMQPDGARGELAVAWHGGGGHSMSWEIVKGKAVIFDNQNGKVFQTPQEINNFTKSVSQAGMTRLDDLPLNNDFLMRWLKDA